jgi:WD40 repeat protein
MKEAVKSKKAKVKAAGWLFLLPFTFCLFTFALAQSTEPIREAWRRPLPEVQCLSISPDGSRIAVVTWAGDVLCWHGEREGWRRAVPGAAAIAVGNLGRAVVYTPLDCTRRDLLMVDTSGALLGRSTVGSPITAVALSPDGSKAAAGTAAGTVEIHRLDGKGRPTLAALPGSVQQLCYDARGGLIVATTDPAWLAALSPDGRVLWRSPAPAGREFRLGTFPRSRTPDPHGELPVSDNQQSKIQNPKSKIGTVVATVPVMDDRRGSSGESLLRAGSSHRLTVTPIELVAYSADGQPTLRQTLIGRDPHLSVMADGSVVVAYQRAERRGVVLRYDRWLACYGPDGLPRWQRGGMVYSPRLVSAAPGGEAVLSLSAGNRFWLLDGRGQPLWSFTAAAPVRIARASADGSAVAVATTDGHLSLLKISPGVRRHHRRSAEVAEGNRRGGR